jgi:hypothetical protein
MSIAIEPTPRRWLWMRFSSTAITRQYSPRFGTSMPASRSAAIAQPWLQGIAAT